MTAQFRKDNPCIPVQGSEVILTFGDCNKALRAIVLFADYKKAILLVSSSYKMKRAYLAEVARNNINFGHANGTNHGLLSNDAVYKADSETDFIPVSRFLLDNAISQDFITEHMTPDRGVKQSAVELPDVLSTAKEANAIECPKCHGYSPRRTLLQTEMAIQACGSSVDCCVGAFVCKICGKVTYTNLVGPSAKQLLEE